MFLKIYFDNKTLFLCDTIDYVIEPYRHREDSVFMETFSAAAIKTLVQEMESPAIHAGILLHSDLDELKKAFWNNFTVILAGGGLVRNINNEVLMIFRRGKWDLPKGKLDEGENIEQCAVREVTEETGVQHIHLQDHLLTTYHTYHEKGKSILKESHWYNMTISDVQTLIPQAEEDIAEARWVPQGQIAALLNNTFPSVKDVLKKAFGNDL